MGPFSIVRHHLQNKMARTVIRQDNDATEQAARDQAAIPHSGQLLQPFAKAAPSEDDARIARVAELRSVIAVDERMIKKLGPRRSSAYQAELAASLTELRDLES